MSAGTRKSRMVLRLLRRDWRAGELTLLLAALVVAVATVTAISLFVGRLKQALVEESATILAADRVITSSRPIPDAFRDVADELGLDRADLMTFPSMIFSRDRNQLVSVKAVTEGYPLRGAVRVADEPFVPGEPVEGIPERGEVWLDGRLFPSLGIALGSTIAVGMAELEVAHVLVDEPDRGGSFFDLGPRLLMNAGDVPATEVVQPGSRIAYRLLLRGPEETLESMHTGIETSLAPNYRWRGVRDSNRSIGSALERAESFLLLGGLLAVLLAGVAVALAATRYARRHYDHVAILKTLGATPHEIQWGYAMALAVIGTVAIAIGLLVGGIVHFAIVELLAGFLPVRLPAPDARPFLVGAITGAVCLGAFALPPIVVLRNISPMRVIRRDLEHVDHSRGLTYAAASAGSLLLLVWYTGSWWLTGWTLAGIGGITLVFGGLAMLLLRGGRIVGMQAGSQWRLALAGLRRRHRENVAQIVIFGLAIMLLLVLVVLRTELIDDWRRQVPEDAPNHFVMNVMPDQLEDVELWLRERARYDGRLYPMIRGRVVAVNGTDSETWQENRRRGEPGGSSLRSERNLSFAEALPPNNRVVAGEWWEGDVEEPLVSVEQEYAAETGISIGDELDFDIGGLPLRAKVASFRVLEWDSMQPNFFILFSPSALEGFPATWMTSFHLEPDQKRLLNELLARFPTLTVIEVDQIIAEIQNIVGSVSQAVELVLALVLVAGCLVLVASIQSSRDERLQEHALLRALGGTRRLIAGALAIEFAVLGAFAGVLATFGAEVTTTALKLEVFELGFGLHPWVWVAGPLLGMVVVASVGLAGTWHLVHSPPVAVLRDLG